MIFQRKDKDDPSRHKCLNSAMDSAGFGPERDDTNKITIPITYPDRRDKKTKAALPSDENVKEAKDWVDYNIK